MEEVPASRRVNKSPAAWCRFLRFWKCAGCYPPSGLWCAGRAVGGVSRPRRRSTGCPLHHGRGQLAPGEACDRSSLLCGRGESGPGGGARGFPCAVGVGPGRGTCQVPSGGVGWGENPGREAGAGDSLPCPHSSRHPIPTRRTLSPPCPLPKDPPAPFPSTMSPAPTNTAGATLVKLGGRRGLEEGFFASHLRGPN